MRRTPAARPCSLTILKRPISPSARACVPPHSSTESFVIVSIAHDVAVLLLENRDGPALARLVDREHLGQDGRVGEHLSVDQVLDARDLLGRERLAVGEVEPQTIRARRGSPSASPARPGRCAAPSAGGAWPSGCAASRCGARGRPQVDRVAHGERTLGDPAVMGDEARRWASACRSRRFAPVRCRAPR